MQRTAAMTTGTRDVIGHADTWSDDHNTIDRDKMSHFDDFAVQVPLSVPTLRELCCSFVSDNDPTLVNYEKILTFIASAIQVAKSESVLPDYSPSAR